MGTEKSIVSVIRRYKSVTSKNMRNNFKQESVFIRAIKNNSGSPITGVEEPYTFRHSVRLRLQPASKQETSAIYIRHSPMVEIAKWYAGPLHQVLLPLDWIFFKFIHAENVSNVQKVIWCKGIKMSHSINDFQEKLNYVYVEPTIHVSCAVVPKGYIIRYFSSLVEK